MSATSSPPILIWQPEGGVPSGPVSNPPVYSQADVTQLVEGQAYIDVVFGSLQTTDDWVLVACEVENTTDFEPLNIWPGIITDRTAAGFRLQLNGMPDSPNYYLHWAVSGINIMDAPATSYQLTGPSSAAFGVDTTFTVKLPPSTTLGTPIIVTPDDGGAGGTFSPLSVTLSASSRTQTFSYTAVGYGPVTISVTNSGVLADPASIVLTIAAPTYAFSGPSSGDVGVASTSFTVQIGGEVTLAMPATVTPHDGGAGGTFTPTTVVLNTGSLPQHFTYTPSSAGDKTISVTNDGGLVNPANIIYTASVPPFDPTLVAGLLAWWKVESIVGLSHADPISSWADSSGNGHTATNSAGARPLYITNVGSAVYFGPGNSLNIATPFSGSGPLTIFVVIGNAGGQVFSLSSPGNNGTAGPSIYSGNFIFNDGVSFNDGPGPANTSDGSHLVTVQSNGTTGAMWVNSVSKTLTTSASAGTGTFSVMGLFSGADSNGFFKAILVYNSVLGTTDRTNVENYLRTEYGTP